MTLEVGLELVVDPYRLNDDVMEVAKSVVVFLHPPALQWAIQEVARIQLGMVSGVEEVMESLLHLLVNPYDV